MLKITTRLTLWYVAVIVGSVIVVSAVLYSVFERRQHDLMDAGLRSYSSYLQQQTDTTGKPLAQEALFDRFYSLTSRANLRFGGLKFAVSSKNSIVLDSAAPPSTDTLLNRLQMNEDMLDAGNNPVWQTMAWNDTNYRILVSPIPPVSAQGNRQLIVMASLAETEAWLTGFRNLLFIFVPVSLLLAGVSGRFLAGRALAPVKELTQTAQDISFGSLHQRVPIGTSNDEVAKLAATFNDMIDRLQGAFTSQRNFITDASHDLRTPLTIIRAELELLLHRPDITPDVEKSVQHSLNEIEKLTLLANDLLLLAKAESRHFDSPQMKERLDELLVDCVGNLNRLAERKATLLNIRIYDPVEIDCDPPKLRRAFTNLIENAITYSPDCSRVSIELITLDPDVQIKITDNGPGIPAQDLPHIFDRFYRSDRSRNTQGSGLGLAIAKAVIDAHKGHIEVYSEVNVGTRVTVTLPMHALDQD